jgi:hypothetical protein
LAEYSKFFIFQSGTKVTVKGGDIGLYLVVKDHTNLLEKKNKFLARIKREIGDQKIDVVFNLDKDILVEKEAMEWGIKL